MNTTKQERIDAATAGFRDAGLRLHSYAEHDDHLMIDLNGRIDLIGSLEEIRRRARSLAWNLQNTAGT